MIFFLSLLAAAHALEECAEGKPVESNYLLQNKKILASSLLQVEAKVANSGSVVLDESDVRIEDKECSSGEAKVDVERQAEKLCEENAMKILNEKKITPARPFTVVSLPFLPTGCSVENQGINVVHYNHHPDGFNENRVFSLVCGDSASGYYLSDQKELHPSCEYDGSHVKLCQKLTASLRLEPEDRCEAEETEVELYAEKLCEQNAMKILKELNVVPGRPFYVGHFSWIPAGCSVQVGGDNTIHYNRDRLGFNEHKQYSVVCGDRKNGYHFSDPTDEHPSCKYDDSSVGLCEKWGKEASSSAARKIQVGKWSWIPSGCAVQTGHDNTVHYNLDVNGKEDHGDFSRMCRKATFES